MAYLKDEMTIKIADVLMNVQTSQSLCRCRSEITVVIPHAEIRRKFDKYGRMIEEELILDSLTIVDSPRHEPGSNPQPPSLPRTTWRYRCRPRSKAPTKTVRQERDLPLINWL